MNKFNEEIVVTPLLLTSVFLTIMVVSFLFGWVFPIEGTMDYIYDDYIGNKTIKKPVVNVPAQKKVVYATDTIDVEDIKEVLIDLNEDGEQEWYLFMPLLKGTK